MIVFLLGVYKLIFLMNVYTLGYEGMNIEVFIGILKINHINVLIDVRDFPYSRKPGFSQPSLKSASETEGIQYLHMKALGAPKPIRDEYKKDSDWSRYTTSYKRHLRHTKSDLDQVLKLALQKNVCLVCFEADANRCHRSFVAAELAKLSGESLKVIHLSKANQSPIDNEPVVFA
jgi:uncharacterized protein (DUF488 family)